ncbi:hypothetical protein EVAR_24598_1 [Eumeta japonica]|uniref:Uncharacterized protein n=1 Tax=Eumeta variegata TaxID=151549 RepID=A0A4C1W555_EUMVA|nr:hypothetical protein EVAR_24598_1 [Eumeta japonica]
MTRLELRAGPESKAGSESESTYIGTGLESKTGSKREPYLETGYNLAQELESRMKIVVSPTITPADRTPARKPPLRAVVGRLCAGAAVLSTRRAEAVPARMYTLNVFAV